MQILYNIFSNYNNKIINQVISTNPWQFIGTSDNDEDKPAFWYNDLYETEVKDLFLIFIESHLQQKIQMFKLYTNGQAHGQCGFWHRDVPEETAGEFRTLVYFPKPWKPEYGGHFIVKENTEYISVLPEFNMGVIINSKDLHMGLEPSIFCKTQRESIACKFRILN